MAYQEDRFKEIADAIRAKTGGTAQIQALNFAAQIRAISTQIKMVASSASYTSNLTVNCSFAPFACVGYTNVGGWGRMFSYVKGWAVYNNQSSDGFGTSSTGTLQTKAFTVNGNSITFSPNGTAGTAYYCVLGV